MNSVYAGTAIVLSMSLLAAARADDPHAGHHMHRSPAMQKCIDACFACSGQCESCFVHCTDLVASGKKDHVATLKSCVDCGDLCAVAGKIMSRDGALIAASCEGCVRACDDCATLCEKYPEDDHMKACAKACRDCSKVCKQMLKSASGVSIRATN